MSQENEYIIILKSSDYLDQFYEEMESNYGSDSVPNRQVECAYRRPMSRSTHYYLTDNEAETVSRDARVLSIERTYKDKGIKIKPTGVQSSDFWDKSDINNSNHVNWGLLRGYERQTRNNWGSDGTVSVPGTINITSSGNNVDIVIIDGHLVANHSEWAVNENGSGSTRLTQFNWFQYNPQVRGTSVGNYSYDFMLGAEEDNNHGNNVAAIACGNSSGWARSANIFNINPYATSTSNAAGYNNYTYDLINYVRVWHANKTINGKTGRKNPTICNMSFGFVNNIALNDISQIVYQGVTYNKPGGGWTIADRANFDLVASLNGEIYFNVRDTSFDADCVDAINEGIILVGSAGNLYMYQDLPGGVNYNNYLVSSGGIDYYMRGSSPAAASGVICVSAVDSTVAERKADYSNAGPRTDIFASGTNIMGAYYTGGVTDFRNASFQKGKMSGTSQASAQVSGILACAMESWPSMTPLEAKLYIKNKANINVLEGGGSFSTQYNNADYTDYNTLYGGPNEHAAYYAERAATGSVFPKVNFKLRPTTGSTYPRTKIRRYG